MDEEMNLTAITIVIEATPEEADTVVVELVDYLIHVEGRTVVNYWVGGDS